MSAEFVTSVRAHSLDGTLATAFPEQGPAATFGYGIIMRQRILLQIPF